MSGSRWLFGGLSLTLACSGNDGDEKVTEGITSVEGGAYETDSDQGPMNTGSLPQSTGSVSMDEESETVDSTTVSVDATDGGTPMGGDSTTNGNGDDSDSSVEALLVEDFELDTVDTTKWTPRINGNGTISVGSDEVHTGSNALFVNGLDGFSTMLAAEGAPVFPAPDNTFYGRVWLFVPGDLPQQNHVIWLEAGTVENDAHEVRIGMNIGRFQTNLYQNGEVDIRAATSVIQPRTWHCVTFKMGNDELEVAVDELRIDAVSTTNWVAVDGQSGNQDPRVNWSPTYEAFRMGWELAASSIWYDDVALGHSPIGCE